MTNFKTILMKKILMLLIFFCNNAGATFNQTMYVALRDGLNVYKNPGDSSNIITRIAYGEAVVIRIGQGSEVYINGFKTRWATINNGKGANGYVAESYLLPIPPPLGNTPDFKQYAEQISKPVAPSTIYEEVNDLEQNLKDEKTLYENGLVLTIHSNYEYLSESLIIPGITIQQAFIIVRNLSPVNLLTPQNDQFPRESIVEKEKNGNYRRTEISYSQDGHINRITFSVENAEITGTLSLVALNGQIAIVYEYGS